MLGKISMTMVGAARKHGGNLRTSQSEKREISKAALGPKVGQTEKGMAE